MLPAEYTVSPAHNNQTIDISSIGEVDLGGKRALQTISFSSFFPKRYDPEYCSTRNIKTPESYVKQITKLMRSGTLRLLMTGTPIRMRCRIESFEWSENDGTGDIQYTLTFREHRGITAGASSVVQMSNTETGTETAEAESPASESTRTEPEKVTGTTYTVKAGDCLSSIARQLTGSADWHALYEQNKDAIGANPNNIDVGLVLTVPEARAEE